MTNLDKYLNPPDEPEAEFCEDCGEENILLDDFGGLKYWQCVNKYCPDKHTGVAREIAIELADARATIEELKSKIRVRENIIQDCNVRT